MPTHYANIEDNSEVMDVLFALLVGCSTPANIQTKLKSGQVRNKLLFLRKEGLIIKSKWKYQPNNDTIYKTVLKTMSGTLAQYERISKNLNKPAGKIKTIRDKPATYFPRDVMLATVTLYAKAFFLGYDAVSFKDIAKAFLSKLAGSGSAKLIRDYPTLKAVKEAIRDVPTVF